MLFDEPVLTHRGITVYRDFSNPSVFYYMPPEAPRIARTAEGGEGGDYAMRLVIYRPDPNAPKPEGFEDGGGFLNLDVDLHVSDAVLDDLKKEIRKRFGVDPALSAVPFIDGSVELVLLGTKTGEENQPFVRKVAGSTVPSLYGDERATFSVVLDRDGAALMRSVVEAGGATMASAIYHLTYVGMGPAYNIKVTIDYQRVYESMDLRLNARLSTGSHSETTTRPNTGAGAGAGSGSGSAAGSGSGTPAATGTNKQTSDSKFVASASFHMLMEELKESRAIQVEIVDPIPGESARAATQEMVNTIIANLMGSTWFKPTLAAASQMTNLTQQASAATGTSSTPPTSTTSTSQPAQPTSTAQPASSTSTAQPAGTQPSTTPATAAQRPNAVLSQTPAATTNTGIDHTPAAAPGVRETLVFRGTPSEVKVGGAVVTLQNNRYEVDVAEGETKNIEVTYAGAAADEHFHLFFLNDHPTTADVGDYTTGTPPASDTRFHGESRLRQRDTGVRGLPALTAWLATLAPNSALELRAHASFDPSLPNPTSSERVTADQALSERRLSVARARIGSGFNTTNGSAHGHTMSQANTVDTVTPGGGPTDGTNGGKHEHRVVIIKGSVPGARTTITGTLARARRTDPVVPPPQQPTTVTDRNSSSTVEAGFEINFEMIKRTEKITAVYELNYRQARKQERHPQGQLVIEGDGKKYLLEADGAIEFFRKLELATTTTAMWEQDGINAIQVQIRYAPRGDGEFQEIGEMFLTPDKLKDTFVRNLQRDKSLPGEPYAYWYDYRVTIHYLDDVALGDTLSSVTSVGAPDADADGWIRSYSRNLVIHPREVTPAMTVNVTTGVMHFELIDRVQLVITYGPHRQNLTLTADASSKRLVIRPEPGLTAVLETSGTLFYKDGAQVALATKQWKPQELVVINEPPGNTLRVQVILADPAHEFQSAQVRLRYVHGERAVEQAFELVRHAQMVEWAVRLENPDERKWQYQATLIETSGAIRTIDWTDGKGDRLILGVQAVDVVPVTVTWLAVPPASGLLAVKIDLAYDDERNDVHWEHSELIRQDHTGQFTWSIAIKDDDLRSYRYRVTEYRATGATEGAWKEETTTALVLLPSA